MDFKVFVFGLCLVFCMIQSSLALKCFTCNSLLNPKCADLSDNKELQSAECGIDRLSQVSNQLGLGNFTDNKNLTATCLKAVAQNGTVVRTCGVRYQKHDPCLKKSNAVIQTNVTQFRFCESCDEDACNSSNSMQLFNTLITFALMLCIVKLFV